MSIQMLLMMERSVQIKGKLDKHLLNILGKWYYIVSIAFTSLSPTQIVARFI